MHIPRITIQGEPRRFGAAADMAEALVHQGSFMALIFIYSDSLPVTERMRLSAAQSSQPHTATLKIPHSV